MCSEHKSGMHMDLRELRQAFAPLEAAHHARFSRAEDGTSGID